MDNYLKILEESLIKKLQLLTKIEEFNEAQRQVFEAEVVEVDKFDEYIEEKEKLIEQVLHIDDGFETLYANVSGELQNNKDKYAGHITNLKELVRLVTEKHVVVQTQEARNKALVEAYFSKEKKQIGQGRRSSTVAYNYYANVNKATQAQPQFLDSRQ